MKHFHYVVLLILLISSGMTSLPSEVAALDRSFVTIGTGGVTGVYYPAGGAIARLINKGKRAHGIRATVESTGGSVYNLTRIQSGELQLGVVQSDAQYYAYNGEERFEEHGANKDLRAIFSMHAESFTIVARQDAGIKKLNDLKGKRVNIGNPGSGQRATLEVVMAAMGWDMDVFSQVSELRADQQARALCDNKVDAMVYSVGHPNGSTIEAASACDVVFVEVSGPEIDRLVNSKSYYRKTTIPGRLYHGAEEDTATFGVIATLVTSNAVSEKIVYELAKAVFDNFSEFKKLHPAFTSLDKREMVNEGLSAPLHDGALKYFKEKGLVK